MRGARAAELKLEPKLRKAVESVLRTGETLSSFVETALQETVERRRLASEFLARGIAAGRAAERENDWRPADEVFAKLEKRLSRARRRR